MAIYYYNHGLLTFSNKNNSNCRHYLARKNGESPLMAIYYYNHGLLTFSNKNNSN